MTDGKHVFCHLEPDLHPGIRKPIDPFRARPDIPVLDPAPRSAAELLPALLRAVPEAEAESPLGSLSLTAFL